MARSPSQVPVALRLLQKQEGVTAEEIQKATGWAVKPSLPMLRSMVKRHGFKLQIERHFRVAPRSEASR